MKKQHVKYNLFLVIGILLSYMPVTILQASTKWDNFSAFLPYKYTASKWWNSGVLPLWDPYQNLGYPMHANPQGGVWYPFTWLLGLFDSYGVRSLNIEVSLHFVIAGLGMYWLGTALKMKKSTAMYAGFAWALSGFVLGSSHMLGFTAAAAWLPWCIWALLEMIHRPSWKAVCAFALIHYMQLTGAYIAFSIVLIYIELGLVIYAIIKRKIDVKQISKWVVALIGLLIISLPHLYSVFDSLEYFSRAEALEYSFKSMGGNFSFACFLSLITPFANSSAHGFAGVDVSLSNIFFGIPLLIFLIGFILFNRSKLKFVYIGLMALALLLALGIHTPLHKFFFNVVPGFNLFRHPYLFSLYFLLLAVICSCWFWQNNLQEHRKKIEYISLFLIIDVIILSIYAATQANFEVWSGFVSSFKERVEQSPLNFEGHVFLQSLLVIACLIVVYFGIQTKKTKWIGIALLFSLVTALQLNAPLNLFYKIDFNWIANHLDERKELPFTNQDVDFPLGELQNCNIEGIPGFVQNKNTFERTTGIDGYNPFIFSSFEALRESEFWLPVLQNGIAYINPDSSIINHFEIKPNAFEIHVNTSIEDYLHLSQNFHHNWHAFINDVSVPLENDHGLMQVKLSKGTNVVQFQYFNSKLVWMFYFALGGFILLLVGLIVFKPVKV